jgi:hypothetical protein
MMNTKSKEMKMTNTPGTPSVTTNVPSQPSPEPVAVTDTSPKIAITNTDKRQIDNLRLSVTFLINGAPYYDYEDHGTFNQVCVDRVYAYGGKWNGSQWVGDFLHTESSQSTGAFLQALNQAVEQASVQTGGNEDNWANKGDGPILPNITIVNEEPRAITGMRVQADFTINGQQHTDYEDIGNFDRYYYLELNGMNGRWDGSKWVGNFLVTKGVSTTIPAGLLTFLNALVVIGMAGNAVAGAVGAAGVIKRGISAEYAGGAPAGGWSLSQQL